MLKDTIYLIDGTSLCYRAFYAIKLSTSRGFPSGAVYGFYQILNKIISRFNPRYMGICFDVSRKTFRSEKFSAYKINRPPAPDDLKTQIPVIKKLIRNMGLALLEKEGLEADDIIACLTRKAVNDQMTVSIVTSDKDMFQLLDNEKVTIYNPVKEKLITPESFRDDFGFSPQFIVDYLSLTGDSVDNIPGAKGIGPAGAGSLIKEFQTIENIFNNLDKIPGRLKNSLIENKESVFLSKELIKLRFDGIDANWQDIAVKEADEDGLFELFSELEFSSLVKKIRPDFSAPRPQVKDNLPGTFRETAEKEGIFFYYSCGYFYVFCSGEVYKLTDDAIRDLLLDPKIKKITYDFKKLFFETKNTVNNAWFDLKIAAYVLDPALTDYTLEGLISGYLGKSFSEIPAEAAPGFIFELYSLFSSRLNEDPRLKKLLFDIEMPLIAVLYGMERSGIKIDLGVMGNLLLELEDELNKTQDKIFKICGHQFNLNSPKQLQAVLFEELKIKPVRKTKTGYSTDEEVLKVLSLNHEIAGFLLDYREVSKLKTTYVLPLIEAAKNNSGILHATFNQASTATGRLSSSSPNLQSIPAKGRFSSALRKAFIPSFQGGFILSADYSQIELRILAHFSGDQGLREAFLGDTDIHSHTARLLFNKAGQKERDLAKKINFAVVYGMGAYGLSQELGITMPEAEAFIRDYFARYPKVGEYIDNAIASARAQGYAYTIMGRRRRLDDLNSKHRQLVDFAKRQAINTPIQGSCADLIKIAMIKISGALKSRNLKTKMIIQIHDELVFDVPGDEKELVAGIVKQEMESGIALSVPVKVNISLGKNWGQMEELALPVAAVGPTLS